MRNVTPLPFRGGAGGGDSLPSASLEGQNEPPSPNPTPPLQGRGLTPKDMAKRLNTPPLQGRGCGWGLDVNRLAELRRRATHMRNNPTEPEKRLWRKLSNGQLNGHKFRRQQVIGHFIADFACPSARMIVEVDGDTHDDPARDQARDLKLADFGYRVLHVTNDDVMRNVEGVLVRISDALRGVANPHPNPSPEGEGLSLVKRGNSL